MHLGKTKGGNLVRNISTSNENADDCCSRDEDTCIPFHLNVNALGDDTLTLSHPFPEGVVTKVPQRDFGLPWWKYYNMQDKLFLVIRGRTSHLMGEFIANGKGYKIQKCYSDVYVLKDSKDTTVASMIFGYGLWG